MSDQESSAQRPMAGFPRLNLSITGVAFGLLWVAGAFAALVYCFEINYLDKPVDPGTELAIANAAGARAAAAEGHAPAPQP